MSVMKQEREYMRERIFFSLLMMMIVDFLSSSSLPLLSSSWWAREEYKLNNVALNIRSRRRRRWWRWIIIISKREEEGDLMYDLVGVDKEYFFFLLGYSDTTTTFYSCIVIKSNVLLCFFLWEEAGRKPSCGFASDERCIPTLLESSFTAGRASFCWERKEREVYFLKTNEKVVLSFSLLMLLRSRWWRRRRIAFEVITYILLERNRNKIDICTIVRTERRIYRISRKFSILPNNIYICCLLLRCCFLIKDFIIILKLS